MPATFDAYHFGYDLYMRLFGLYRVREVRETLALRCGERLLDIGGGTGYVARRLAGAGSKPVVLDESRRMLGVAARRDGVRPVRGDAALAPLADASFDAALLTDVLHHVAEAATLLDEARRVLRPGGRLLIHDVDLASRQGRRLARWESLLFRQVHFRTRRDLEATTRRAGFRLVRERARRSWFILLFVRE